LRSLYFARLTVENFKSKVDSLWWFKTWILK
jgi:hypothetical protein